MTADDRRSSLPYDDAKPVGAADFYFAINATFRFIQARFGREGLRRYWRDLAGGYYSPVTRAWREGGLSAVATYWRDFFKAEPGAEVEVRETPETVTVEVAVCPAIKHLRAHRRQIVPCFCEHCYYVSERIGLPAGITVRVRGGNGACGQTFRRIQPELPPQDLAQITEAT